MTEAEFVARVAEKAGVDSTTAGRVVRAIFTGKSGAIADALQSGERLSLKGFGTFSRAAFFDHPAVVGFAPAQALLRRVREGFRPQRRGRSRQELRTPAAIATERGAADELTEAEFRAVLVAGFKRLRGIEFDERVFPRSDQQPLGGEPRPRGPRRVRARRRRVTRLAEKRASIGEILRRTRGLEIEDVYPTSEQRDEVRR